ncbi:hypothetical protein H5410_061357 [Solanum commersonii]|uniref:Uncharacterized protein n=1 Tax=Solanum commersonii TaxID=4109 RepID=A0A9J5W8D5_SOLCO|nr:hypothetical protein H5410_061357 [Solanum commersonii]
MGQKQMIIEIATLCHQLEASEEREAFLRNNLGDHQVWLNNCHENMGRAKQVVEQAWAIVPHLPKVLLNLYETLGGQRKPQEDNEN